MHYSTRQHRGFTIIELLVVIGVIAVLIGLLMPALLSARKSSRKTAELNRIRQVGVAWNLYSNANNDSALPGYLETAVQQNWRVTYKFPDGGRVPPAPSYLAGDENIAGPWTWRLLQYLDYSHDVIRYYKDEDTPDMLGMSDPDMAEDIAQHPAFGYNGHYLGGYYEMQNVGQPGDDPVRVPLTRFKTALDSSGRVANLLSRSISAIDRPDQIVAFCTAAQLPVGVFHEALDDVDGTHLVHPPYLANVRQWGRSTTSRNEFEVFRRDAPTPLGRFDGAVVVLFADGHVNLETPLALDDMRRWIDEADSEDWYHE